MVTETPHYQTLFTTLEDDAAPITLLQNWHPEVKKIALLAEAASVSSPPGVRTRG